MPVKYSPNATYPDLDEREVRVSFAIIEGPRTNTALWTAPGDPSTWSLPSPVKRPCKPRSYQFLNWWWSRKHLGLNPSDLELARFLRQRSWRRLI